LSTEGIGIIKRFLGFVAVVVFVLAFGGSAAGASAATLSGSVTGQTGGKAAEPVVGAAVSVLDPGTGEEVGSTSTDAAGSYSLPVPSGVYNVSVKSAEGGFGPTFIKGVEVEVDRTLNVVLTAAGTFRISGTLRDAAGHPVPGAQVVANTGETPTVSTTTGADGSFSLAAPPGRYELTFRGGPSGIGLPGTWLVEVGFFQLESDREFEFALPPTAAVTVEARGDGAAPLVGARVQVPYMRVPQTELGGLPTRALQSENVNTTTDAQGRAPFTVFRGSASSTSPGQVPSVFPAPGSDYGYTNFGIPTVEGDTTVVVSFHKEQPESPGPKLKSLTIEPAEIDTSASEQIVTLRAVLTDDSAEVVGGFLRFYAPSGDKEVWVKGYFNQVSGTSSEGTFEAHVIFPELSEPGVWSIGNFGFYDRAFEGFEFDRHDLEEAGFPGSVTVAPIKIPAPAVTEVKPGAGPEAGGTEVTISGTGLGGAQSVRFGTKEAGFKVSSANSITATAPPGSGTVDVTVVTSVGTSATSEADRFRYSPPVTLTSSSNPSVHGAKVTLTARVKPLAEGVPTPLGTIQFVEGSSTIGVVNLSKGVAILNTTSLGAGEHQIVARYGGDGYFGAGESEALNQTVAKAGTQLTLVSTSNPTSFGSAGQIKATVKAVAPGAGTPAGTVTFREGATQLATVQLAAGTASYPLKSLSPGVHEISATYSGDPNDEPAAGEALVQSVAAASTELTLASSLNPAPYGSAGTLKATVAAPAPGGGIPSGTVTFREGKTDLATVPLTSGAAKLALKALAPGSHAITAVYEGNGNYLGSESATVQEVTRAATASTLESTLNPAAFGSAATLKMTVKAVAPGGGTPSGNVTFSEGETVLAVVPLSAGVARYAIKPLAPGSHPITATYGGGETYEGSEAGLTQTVVKAETALTLTSTKNPAPPGSTGSLKATVKTVSPGGGTAAGTVVFREGETVLANVPLASGSATLPLKSLPVGSHEISATYGGAGGYEPASGTIVQVIGP
jgi:hypothetical protein